MISGETKNVLIWLMFGLYFGTYLARVIRNCTEIGVWDWLLIMAEIAIVVIHYTPYKTVYK